MFTQDPDDLVPFLDVSVLRSTAPALLCQIGDRAVWLPRGHISGKLWCAGDRGKLFIRRWVVRDRQLREVRVPASGTLTVASPDSTIPAALHLVRRERDADPAV